MNFVYQISLNWFVIYYFCLGLILLINGLIWYRKPFHFQEYLREHAESGKRPLLVMKTLRYLALFSALSLLLSLVPFSVVELIFSLWSLLMVFIFGSIMLKWDQLQVLILKNPEAVMIQIKKGGLMMISIGFVLFMLTWYRLTSWGYS